MVRTCNCTLSRTDGKCCQDVWTPDNSIFTSGTGCYQIPDPEFVKLVELEDRIEIIFKQRSLVSLSNGAADYGQVFKKVYKAEGDKIVYKGSIQGEIKPPQPESYEFPE